mgnify:FL=1
MNKEKLEECSKLLEDSMSVLQKDTELWKQFLQFATQFTYYRFRDQLLIYAQNQQATACATFAQWKRIGRYVRSGEHSIVLLDETGLKPKLRHVFDVMSTGPEKEFAYRPKPILSEEREEFAKQLSAVYAKENSSYFTDAQQWEGDLEHTLSQIALYMTQQYYGVSLEQAAEHSENGEIPTYYVATATSAMYLLLSKYGFEKEANQLDFSCMEQLDEKQFENVGTAASAILSRTARMIRQIHPQIQRETQTEKQPERSHENEERIDNRGYSQENHISSGGELYGTGHWTAGGRGGRTGTEKVRNDEKEVSGGEQSVAVREHGDARNTVSRDEEGGRSSRPDPGTDASEAGKGSRSDSGIEANESAGVGAQDGSLQSSGRGSDSGGTGVQLTLSDYLELRPTDRESVSESDTPKIIEQEKLYDISEKAGSETEEEQEAGGESPTASFMPKNEIPESEVVRVLQSGSGIENGKIRIAALFLSESDGKKRVDFLKEEYGIGGRTHYFEDGTHGWVDWDAKGILISKSYSSDAARLRLPWIQVEKRLGELIRYDQYLKPDEKEELSKIENKYGTLPLPMVRFEYPYEDRTQEPTESETQNFGLADDFLTVRETEDGYVVWDSMQEGIHTEPDGTIGGPYADKAQAQLHKYEFEKKILERSEQDKSHVLSEQKETQAAPEKEGVSESDTQKADGQEETETGISDSLIKPDQSIQSKPVPAQNFHITDDHIGEGGAKQKFRANMDAVNTLHKIEIENRNATAQEQEILSKYVGWGGLADAFDEKKDAWASEYSELKEVLTEEEYTAARESTLNAHYTSPVIIRGIYNALEQFGFQGGSILEPSMGIGNFFGMLPDSMKNSRLYGVELDSVSGRIAKKLYPNAQITVAGFETTNQHDFYDLAIGNVPFGNYKVNDRGYNRLGFSIHNYFFAKALDQIRPGGIMAFVTSHYTMDSKNPAARRYLSQRAELLGAIRLPDNAFRAAGAEVVSDILFLKKRDHIMDIDEDWVHLDVAENGYAMNSYFVSNPEMILGTLEEQTTQFGKECTVKAFQGKSLSEVLSEAIKKIRGHYEAVIPSVSVSDSDTRETEEILPADPTVTNYSYTLVNGEVYYRENSVMKKTERSQTQKSRTKGLLEIRNALNTVIQLQLENASDEEVKEAQKKLEVIYDQFTKDYGLINSRQNAQMLDGDSSYFLLCSLENIGDKGELLSKADIFTKRTIRAQQEITSAETPTDALAVSIGEKGHVDLAYMADLLGKSGTENEIAQALSGVIFRDPQEKHEQLVWKTADEYLSGNVRTKLRAARMAKISDPTYEVNVKALEQAQPKDLTASEIDVRLGATWIDAKYIEEFMYETFHTTYHQRRQIHVSFATVTGEWQISGKSTIYSGDVVAHAQYGTARMSAYEILEQTLNLRNVTVYDRVDDGSGNVKSVVNPKETMFAQQKQQTIKEAFQNWIWKDPFRREELEKTYNERFNSLRPAEFSGEHIHFVGMNPLIGLRTHQKNAVAHILYGGNTLLAHEVGAGKTYTMAAAAMESKRLGLCRKSLFVVPNHLTLQWANEFLHLYPAANLLVASKKDFEAANRKKFCARIATGDYDAIIIGHSQFERIPVSPERQEKILQSQLEEIEDAIQQSAWQRGQAFTVKQLEKTRKTIKQKLEKLRAEERKDNVVTFEQLGIDRLFVDEAHCYKNLFLYTKMRNVAGLSVSEAQKSSDMFMKCQYMDELTGGKGIIFATGTPVSNSMTELYTMMRYLQYGTLKEHGLTQFDAWASVFGETVTASELAPEGTGYRQKTRFAKFFNLPELMNLFKQAADIQTADQLKLPVPEADIQTVVVQPSDLQKEMVASLSERAAQIHNGAVDPSQDNMLKVTSDGRKIGLDQRLMNPLLPDDPNSKLNACVKNVLRIWEEGKENRLTQLIFCDNSTPKAGVFNVYDDVKEKLLAAGVPKEEVAFIHTADTEVKKKELFSKVRSGQVRILLGSTQKMGAGTNVQERLIAVHHLDVGWRPSDMTQRNGRIIRQGNMNPIVQVYNYVTEGTFDAYLWQTLENKQKFISQIMTSKSPVRSCEDVDEQVLSYAEVKALCAGDDRIKEKMDLEVEVARLRMLKAEHQSTKYRLEDQLLKILPEQIQKKTAVIESLEKDQKTAEQHPAMSEESISIDILGTTYTDRKEAAKALIETGKLCSTTQILQIGSYRGFELEGCVNVITAEIQIVVKGELAHPISLSSVGSVNLIRLDNVLQKLPEQIELEKGKLEALIQQQEDAKKQLQEPFGQENELREKTKRLEELSCELDVDSHGKPEVANANEESREKLKSHNQTRQLPPRQSRFSRFRQKKEEPEIDEELEYE